MARVEEREQANEVSLRGRLSRDPEVRTLPSGDELVLLRVVAERPDGSRTDSLPVCVGPAPVGRRRRRTEATRTTVRRAARLSARDAVAVRGWLQRRFWDAGGQRRSRLQVVATEVRVADG